MFQHLRFGSAIKAGLIATLAMTTLMYGGPLMGLPKMDIMLALGSLFPWKISPYIPGAILHFGIGSTLALLYALLFARLLPGPGWARGVLYSLLLWMLAIFAMGPMMAMVQSLTHQALASQVMNPCAAVNPCGVTSRPANPCVVAQMPANPCSAVKPQAINPCAATTPQAVNPCAAVTKALNPCGAPGPAQAASSSAVTRLMSLIAHLLYGAALGLFYRPKREPQD
ncbi:MAG: DUF6789 family protein [Candidatus Methylomirabilales bacterium]